MDNLGHIGHIGQWSPHGRLILWLITIPKNTIPQKLYQHYGPSQSCVSNEHWRETAWHEVMQSVASAACWGNIVVWSLLGPLGTERTEWFRRASSELAHMAGEELWSDHVINRFHQFLWDLPRALLQSNLQGGPAWREVHRSVRMLGKHICLVEKVLERINVALYYTVLFASYAMSA